jgi:hypothetical protein
MIRETARKALSPNTRHALRSEIASLKTLGVRDFTRWNALLIDAAMRERRARSRYRILTEGELVATRRSDTVFIYGSGASLNEITPAEWAHMAQHDTFGFTAFIYQKWIRVGYHLIRGGIEGSLLWRAYAEDFCASLNRNANFDDAVLILQGEYFAMFANQILGYKLIRPNTRIFRYRTARGDGPPTRTFAEGIRHGAGTLCDSVNVAACMGWKHIVLAGVDLYDSRYYWLPPDKTLGVDDRGLMVPVDVNPRGHRVDQAHNTARNGIVDVMAAWRSHLQREQGIEMSVFNPRSLLASVMPVYRINERVPSTVD